MKKKHSQKLRAPFLLIAGLLLSSCFPSDIKEQMNENIKAAQHMFADQEFKKAIAHIELHKLRNGSYPKSLNEIQFLSAFDSSTFKVVEYHKLDSGYELNINFEFPAFTGANTSKAQINYPEEFWIGLGCVRSNARSN